MSTSDLLHLAFRSRRAAKVVDGVSTSSLPRKVRGHWRKSLRRRIELKTTSPQSFFEPLAALEFLAELEQHSWSRRIATHSVFGGAGAFHRGAADRLHAGPHDAHL